VRAPNQHLYQDGVISHMASLHLDFLSRAGAEYTFKVMLVLKLNVLLNNGDTSRLSVFLN